MSASALLLVGEVGPRFEPELSMAGFACTLSATANDAVAQLKGGHYTLVVVPPKLHDMGGIEFIHGVLRFFDANVVLMGNGVDLGEIDALTRTGRVLHLPHLDGRPLLELVAKAVPRAPPPLASAATPMFNLNGLAGAAALPSTGLFQMPAAAPFAHAGFPQLSPVGFGATPSTGFGVAPSFANNAAFSAPIDRQQFEGLADELSRARQELRQAQVHAADMQQQRAALLAEVEAARRSAMAQVADVMALSDEGHGVPDDEVELLRDRATTAEAKLAAVQGELELVVDERDAIVNDAAQRSAVDAQHRLHASSAQQHAEAAQLQLNQFEAELTSIRQLADNLASELHAAQDAKGLSEGAAQQLQMSLQQLTEELSATRDERDAAIAAQQQREQQFSAQTDARAASSDAVAAVRADLDKTRAEVASARTDATTARLDLQEAIMRGEEMQRALDVVSKGEAALRADAEPLKLWAEQVVKEHVVQQAQLEQLRIDLDTMTRRAATVDDLQRRLDVYATEHARSGGAATGSDEFDVLLARSRQLAGLVRALEPFMWGLTQATAFYGKHKVDGGDEHMRLLQQLQGVLLRLRDEIAMLDLG